MKNILVTGGAGFIGSHTVVELLQAGYNPIIIDNLANSDSSITDGIQKITGKKVTLHKDDYTDQEKLREIFKKESIDGVIHFAARKAVGESVQEPLKYYATNVAGLISLLEVMEEFAVPNFVFSSSCTVYGNAEKLPISEEEPLKPAASPYGTTKQMGETIIKDVTVASNKMRSALLRYFNPIGAHESALIGELPKGVPNVLVPFITQTAAGWRDKLTIFGNDYPTPDGTCIRDYIHVIDLARAHIKALEFVDNQTAGACEAFNIGTGVGTSVLEAIKTFESVTKQKVPFEIGPRRPGDVMSAYAAVDKAQKTLGWKAEKTLDQALADAWRWQQTLTKP